MQNIQFDPSGKNLVIDIQYFGKLTASYVYTLWGKDSNAKVDEKKGNNQNSQDDKYTLPLPVDQNEGRLIEVFSTLNNPSGGSTEKETVGIKIFQGSKLLFTQENPSGSKIGNEIFTFTDEKAIDAGRTELSDPFIKLIV